jgi:hypothetical protein
MKCNKEDRVQILEETIKIYRLRNTKIAINGDFLVVASGLEPLTPTMSM